MEKAVIFDCDGVLVDSEEASCGAAVISLAEHGVLTDLAEIKTMIGKSNKEVIEYFKARDRIDLDINTVNKAMERNYMRMADKLQPMPGIIGVLEKLNKAKIPLAVASSGGYDKISFSLDKTGLTQYFPVICSAFEVPKGKPEPDLFLYTAMKLREEPAKCIVVEDSLYGIIAAKKAGMVAVGYTASFTRQELLQAGADCIVTNFNDFFRELEKSGFKLF